MNVLLITNELGYRGTPRFLVNCAALARQAGHQALVWGLQEGGAAERACAEHGIPVRIGLAALADFPSLVYPVDAAYLRRVRLSRLLAYAKWLIRPLAWRLLPHAVALRLSHWVNR